MSLSQQNWNQYQLLLEKYIELLKDNPFVDELIYDLKNKKIQRFIKYFNKTTKEWILNMIDTNFISINIIDNFNKLLQYDDLLSRYTEYITNNISIGESDKLLGLLSDSKIFEFKKNIEFEKKIMLNPSPLKFVTTTAICFIDTHIDFTLLYKLFTAPTDILKDKNENIYHDNMVGKIVGCKTGNLPIKGHFKKDSLGDFYNCATINIVINTTKDANIKIFNNGKLQMTGIPKPEIGKTVCNYICNEIKAIYDKSSSEDKEKLVINHKRLQLLSYNTVMMNTCYEIGQLIDREALFKILLNRYKLNTIYDSEGYPGVRIEYYYNNLTLQSENEGKCKCSVTCKGKGTGNGDKDCRKISIAIFQSGSAIIAGGCNSSEPIYSAYNFINKILQEIILEIIKTTNNGKKNTKKPILHRYIDKSTIGNIDIYDKLVKYNNNCNIQLKISVT